MGSAVSCPWSIILYGKSSSKLAGGLVWSLHRHPTSLCCFSQQLLSLFFPSPVRIALDKNPPYKKIMKTENREVSGGHCKTGCCHPGLCSRPWHLPRGGCILCPAGRFQLTCWECPQWVTTFNSIGAICCPLGCFWTAAWLRTQLVTGNVTIVWLIFKLGGGGGQREKERKAQT